VAVAIRSPDSESASGTWVTSARENASVIPR
jgi:hypothetical protein